MERDSWNSKEVNAFVYQEDNGDYTMVDFSTETRHVIPRSLAAVKMFGDNKDYCFLVYWFKETNYKYFKPLISNRAQFIHYDYEHMMMHFNKVPHNKQLDYVLANAKVFKETYGA